MHIIGQGLTLRKEGAILLNSRHAVFDWQHDQRGRTTRVHELTELSTMAALSVSSSPPVHSLRLSWECSVDPRTGSMNTKTAAIKSFPGDFQQCNLEEGRPLFLKV